MSGNANGENFKAVNNHKVEMAVEAVDSRLPRFGGGNGEHGGGERQEEGDAYKAKAMVRARTTAEKANALDVYEDAVQEPLLECSNLASLYYQAQQIGSRRPEAKVLREDFCSSAIVAQTWLGLDKEHDAQGVDIDLAALKVARARLAAAQRKDRRAILLQSAGFSASGETREVEEGDHISHNSAAEKTQDQAKDTASSSTWSDGAASDRFERRFQARLAKERAKLEKSLQDGVSSSEQPSMQSLTLLHSDVLDLPLQNVDMVAPDLVYAGNYALSYFHDRKTLLAYLKQCMRTLRPETGVLIVDPFAGPTSWDADSPAEREEQEKLWTKFSAEPGFLRAGEERPPSSLKGDVLEFWRPDQESHVEGGTADWRSWPRGRLVLVRKGNVAGGYEYWREDGPLDYSTNRFRMSLSFRFKDGSWLRDYFSYDFRVWSLREITEAMEEVGFERISIHAIPRTVADTGLETANGASEEHSSSDGVECSDGTPSEVDEDSMDGMADLLRQTELSEGEKSTYKELAPSEKLFAKRSFGTYVVACLPSDHS